jgi:aspartate oxidase
MARSPHRDDVAAILKLAENGLSVRKIATVMTWSRPTIAKVLAQAGFDPTKGKLPVTPLGAEAPEGSFD